MLVEITSHVLKMHSVGVRKYNSPAWYCIYCIFGSNFNLFFLQLYKTRDDKYLLDMQRVTGPQLLFLEFCAAFLTNLRVL
uniref:non-specific serine/threonine protein kinase n=1 Tax=Aegilops tauschii subsp. strangulata TaxID=200361 RepID=A0A453GNI8_AEGTS